MTDPPTSGDPIIDDAYRHLLRLAARTQAERERDDAQAELARIRGELEHYIALLADEDDGTAGYGLITHTLRAILDPPE